MASNFFNLYRNLYINRFNTTITTNKIHTDIKFFVQNLGQCKSSISAYDTASVALIPKLYQRNKPEFPETLDWIINNQSTDGSWGGLRPHFIHGNIACSLASLIALKTWNFNKQYDYMISNGEKALKNLIPKIESEEFESIGYEVIIPALLKKSIDLKLNVPIDSLQYRIENKKKLIFIENFLEKNKLNIRHIFWFNLELMEGYNGRFDKYLKLFDDTMLESDGSICVSPAATAFYMRMMIENKNYFSLKAFKCIKNLIKNGGVPQYTHSDTHEISWCLAAFIMGGMDLSTNMFKPKLEELLKLYKALNGLIPFSSIPGYTYDCDCTSVCIYVLRRFNYISDEEAFQSLKRFFNGNYFICYEAEHKFSTSVNFHAIMALKMLAKTPEIDQMLSNWKTWIRSQVSLESYIFEDKWFLSPYYTLSRAVFALQHIDDELCEKCINQVISKQNRDKGWGCDGSSTLEETAYVVLALNHWFTSNSDLLNENHESFFISILEFTDNFKGDPYIPFWVGKGSYSVQTLIEAHVIASKYALTQLITLCKSRPRVKERSRFKGEWGLLKTN